MPSPPAELGALAPEMSSASSSTQQIGALSLEIKIMSANIGLTSQNLELHNPFAYKFTKELVRDIQEIFNHHQAQGWFVCEYGHQHPDKSIDNMFKERHDALLAGTHRTPHAHNQWSFVDTSTNGCEYLEHAVEASQVQGLEVQSIPPYAYIGKREYLRVSAPELFYTVPGNTKRRAALWDVSVLGRGVRFAVVDNHSPTSNQWDKLNANKKEVVFRTCVDKLSQHPMWIMCGDYNTKKGSLETWKNTYVNQEINIHQARERDPLNLNGDFMLSQGFSTRHVESTMGKSFATSDRRYSSDSHNMITFCGIPLGASSPELPSVSDRPRAMTARISTQPTRAEEYDHKKTGNELKIENYTTGAAKSRATTHDSCVALAHGPAPQRTSAAPSRAPASHRLPPRPCRPPPQAGQGSESSTASQSVWKPPASSDSANDAVNDKFGKADWPSLRTSDASSLAKKNDTDAESDAQSLATTHSSFPQHTPNDHASISGALELSLGDNEKLKQIAEPQKQLAQTQAKCDLDKKGSADAPSFLNESEPLLRSQEHQSEQSASVQVVAESGDALMHPAPKQRPFQDDRNLDKRRAQAPASRPAGDAKSLASQPATPASQPASQPAGAAKSLADDAQTLLLRTLVQHAEDNDDAAVSEAADSLLQSLHAPVTSLRYNKVHERLDTLFSIREKIIKSMARNEAEEDTTYTEAEWEVWLTTETFDRERMGKAIAIMRKEHFQPKNHKTLQDATSNEAKPSKERSDFRAWMQQEFGHAALGKIFVKYQICNVADLLEDWSEYIQSPEYKKQLEKHRPKKDRVVPTDEDRVSTTDQHQETVSPPRPNFGRGSIEMEELQELKKLRKNASKGKASPAIMRKFDSGELDRELEALTRKHGSGRYYDTTGRAVDLRQNSFEDFLKNRSST